MYVMIMLVNTMVSDVFETHIYGCNTKLHFITCNMNWFMTENKDGLFRVR
jgi:hypothetical protein